MTINNILNVFSFPQTQQEEDDEPSFIQATAISITVLAAGILAVQAAEYGYAKYSTYRFCQGVNKWCQEGGLSELNARQMAASLMQKCYWEGTSSLNLSELNITTLPPEIGKLVNLEKLYLYNTQLRELPPEIGKLVNLREINLGNTQLQQLPTEIGQLVNLEELYLYMTQLQHLPPEIGQLVNLREINLDSTQLQHLPQEILQLVNLREMILPPSTAQASQEVITSLRSRGVAVNTDYFQGSAGKFTVNLQQLQDDPISVLQALHKVLQQNHRFPEITYEDSEGIDAGGLSRDLVTRLFEGIFDKENPQLPILTLDDKFLPVVDPDFDDKSYQSQQLYQAIGMIFAAATQKGLYSIVTGEYFHPILFEMLYNLCQENVSKIPEQLTTFNDLPKDILKNLLASYLFSKIAGSDDQKKESASLLAEAFIENQYPDPFKIYESKEEFLSVYKDLEKILSTAPGVLAIAQGMYEFLQNWKLNSDSAADLQLNIEGYFSREDVVTNLSWQEGANSPQNDQTKEFLIKWIKDEATPLKTVSQFLFAGTGSSTLLKNQNLQVTFYSAEGPAEGPEWFPKYHACSLAIEIPRNYPDYETFKKMLEASIKAAHFGFQAN